MVQFVNLPAPTSPGNEAGKALGSGLYAGFQKGNEVAFNRGMLKEALGSLKNLPEKASPFELATSLMEATAGIPGAERYVGTLYPLLLEQHQARQKASPEVAEALNRNPGQGSNLMEGDKISPNGLKELLGEQYFPDIQPQERIEGAEGFRPQKPLVPPKPIGVLEESKIRKALIDKGITNPALIDDFVNKAKAEQENIYKAQKEGFANVEDYQKARMERDNNFFQQAELELGQAHGEMTPSEKSIWREMSRLNEDLPDSERFAATEQLYNGLIGNPLISFENEVRGLPTGSIFRPGEVKDRLDFARDSIQDNLRRIEDRKDLSPNLKSNIKNELRNQYFTEMGRKDFGVAQAAYAVSNLNENTRKSVPMAPAPKEALEGFGGGSDKVYLGDPKEREKHTYALANAIKKMSPDDSLILLREQALKNNYDDKAFNQALNLAINSGFKLSDYQGTEKQKLSIPQRLDLDSIMEGKRSLYDLFKGKQ